MKSTIRCLFVDDNDEDRTYFPLWIEAAWGRAVEGVELEVTVESHPLQAAQAIGAYDLLVCDIMWGRDRPFGLSLIAEARERREDLAIVAVSDFGDEGQLDKALQEGADEQVSKHFLRKGGGAALQLLGQKLRNAVEKRQGLLVGLQNFNLRLANETLGLLAMVASVGEENIAGLVRAIAGPSCREGEVSALDQGLSGASVMNVDCRFEPVGAAPFNRGMLLKVSQSRCQIEGEVGRRDQNRMAFPQTIFPRPWGGLVMCGDWYGLASEFVVGGQTLRSWVLGTDFDIEEVQGALESLIFSRNLASVWSETVVSAERPLRWFRKALVGPSRAARILHAAEELEELAEVYLPKDPSSWRVDRQMLRYFLDQGVIGGRAETDDREGVRSCRSHGDFHARNLVRGGDGLLWAVDEGSIGVLPWPSDLARLTVDLIMCGVGIGREEHEWGRLGEWLEMATAVTLGRTDDRLEKAPLEAAAWLVRATPRVFPGFGTEMFPTWQYRLAVACEFLRASYRVGEIGTPKRVLGLAMGCRALRFLGPPWGVESEGG